MSAISLLTFSNQTYNYSKKKLISSAKRNGINKVYSYSDKDFAKTDFYQQHRNIASQPRGAGYWIWKPYYILEHLRNAKDGELLLYCDSGLEIISPLNKMYRLFEEKEEEKGIMLFHNYQAASYMDPGMEITSFNKNVECRKNKYWAKRDVFVLMGLDEPRYWDSMQLEGCIGIFKKTPFSLKFVEEWLQWCCNEQILTDLPNACGKPNFPHFIMHIHDQVVLSLLAEKYALQIYRCPSQYGNHMKLPEFREKGEFILLPYSENPLENSPYGTLFNHHRIKKMPFPQQQLFDTKVFVRKVLEKMGIMKHKG